VMAGVHPRGDLAPRDVVTRGMAARMAALGVDHLYLDATGMPAASLERRFPTILARCRAAGVEPTREWIPVSPAAHYLMGGVLTDLDGRTTLPGLYAVGEAACTGVHGANRLASNSLLEGLVFAARIAEAIAATRSGGWPPFPLPSGAPLEPITSQRSAWYGNGLARDGNGRAHPADRRPEAGRPGALDPGAVRGDLRRLMTAQVGVLRSGDGLAAAARRLSELAGSSGLGPGAADGDAEGWETANLLQLGGLLARLALAREESRGAHHRREYAAPVDAWRVRQVVRRGLDGHPEVARVPVPATEQVPR